MFLHHYVVFENEKFVRHTWHIYHSYISQKCANKIALEPARHILRVVDPGLCDKIQPCAKENIFNTE